MKRLLQLGLACLLATGAFANHGGGRIGSVAGGHRQGSVRTLGHGRYGGYGYFPYLYDYGGFDGDDYGYYPPSADQGGLGMTVNPQPVQSEVSPPVHPVIHEYRSPEDYGASHESQNAPMLYLIAFRDKTIRAAMTYWVQDDTLHYLDTDHQEQRAALSSVDRQLSAQLNRERRVPFAIQ